MSELLKAARAYIKLLDEPYHPNEVEEVDWVKYPEGGDRWSHEMEVAIDSLRKEVDKLEG
jgi:hypothetical protein